MSTELMQWEKDVIINSMLRKSSKEIAYVLDLPEKTVSDFISISAGKDVVTKDQKIYENKIFREQNKPEKKKRKIKPVVTSARITFSTVKRVEKIYKNRSKNFEHLIPVKIDDKTHIFIQPGQDPQKVKQQFLKNIDRSKDFSNHNNHHPHKH